MALSPHSVRVNGSGPEAANQSQIITLLLLFITVDIIF